MAHIGKSYELAFRRDLGLQCTTNRNSWPKVMLIGCWNCLGTVGSHAFGVLSPVTVDFDLPSGRMFKRTATMNISGTVVYYELDLTIRGFPQLYAGTITVFRSNGVMLYQSKVSNNTGRYSGFSGQDFGDQLFETPDVWVWNREPQNASTFARAKGWHD